MSEEQGGVNLWVSRTERIQAENIMHQNMCSPTATLCERCNRNPATVHITVWQDEVKVVHNLCRDCQEGEA